MISLIIDLKQMARARNYLLDSDNVINLGISNLTVYGNNIYYRNFYFNYQLCF